MRAVGSFSSVTRRPPRFAPLPDIWIHVRVHPGTEHGIDLAPSRSASVKPSEPVGFAKGAYADHNGRRDQPQSLLRWRDAPADTTETGALASRRRQGKRLRPVPCNTRLK